MLKDLSVLEIIKFLSGLCYAKKRLDKSGMIKFKVYDVKDWPKNNYNTHITHISRSKGNQAIKFGQLIKHSVRNI